MRGSTYHCRARGFVVGLVAAVIFGGCAAAAAAFWANRADVHLRDGFIGNIDGFAWAGLAWILALICLVAWRAKRLGSWAPLLVAGIELGVLYYHGTTEWGWSIALPQKSVVLTKLSELPNVLLIGGELQNLTIRANLSTATPYLGFAHPYPNKLMVAWEQLFLRGSLGTNISGRGWDVHKRWLRRWQVTHLVGHGRSLIGMGKELGHWRDTALDAIVYHPPSEPAARVWSIIELEEPFPVARVVTRARTITVRGDLDERLSLSDDLDLVLFLARDEVPSRPDARFARLISWDGTRRNRRA